jgi:uncharacterized membrane protein
VSVFRARNWLDRVFAVGIIGKGLNGAAELVGGLLLLLFIAYQLYRIVLNPTAGLIGLTVFDAVIVALTWREYHEQRRGHHDDTTAASDAAGHVALPAGPTGDTTG